MVKKILGISFLFALGVVTFCFFRVSFSQTKNTATENTPVKTVLYTGEISHIFFHSLIIYPELAFGVQDERYRDFMVTQEEFKKILPLLYQNNFVLINIHSIYQVDKFGTVSKKDLYLPPGKKPLILSLDDLSYDRSMSGHGFADKLVLDKSGNVATEVVTKDGTVTVTRDGDVVPLVDDFVKLHPDFSIDGAKGVIAVTGFAGILGYHTSDPTSSNYSSEFAQAKIVADTLKNTGWSFADHSFAHSKPYLLGTITLPELQKDITHWKETVGSIVGPTDIFIGPFGQIFKPGDVRRDYLVQEGYTLIGGVGMDRYLHYFPNYVAMNRADIDGIRLFKTPWYLKRYFDPQLVTTPVAQ